MYVIRMVSNFPLSVLPETGPDSTCLDALNYVSCCTVPKTLTYPSSYSVPARALPHSPGLLCMFSLDIFLSRYQKLTRLDSAYLFLRLQEWMEGHLVLCHWKMSCVIHALPLLISITRSHLHLICDRSRYFRLT